MATSVDTLQEVQEVVGIAESTLSSSTSWRVRQAAVNFLAQISHTMVLHPEVKMRACEILDKALGDSMLEVRTSACFSIAGLLRSLPEDKLLELVARAPKPRRRGAKVKEQSEEDRAAQLVRRHAKVSCCRAMLVCFSHPSPLPCLPKHSHTCTGAFAEET